MTDTTVAFGSYLQEHINDGLDALVDRVFQESPGYRSQGVDGLHQTMYSTLLLMCNALVTGSEETIVSRLTNAGADRAQDGYMIDDILIAIRHVRNFVWDRAEQFIAAGAALLPADARALEDLLHLMSRTLMLGYSQTYQQTMQAVAQQAAEIEAQRYTIRELGTPILPLYEGVIALPLVGAIDSYRATQVLERLLEAISEKQADIVILDITGVPVVDTGVANYLLQTARAAQLIGAQVVLVGIGAEIAQTLVQLGVSLSQLKVYANLQAGISYALGQLGYKITAS
ncbi:STAS domain-containing protein [Oscillochloris sp. ZM17-4]|uniref:STAS domain-containing protein n=1 Tax=Oscillochloris sp. ZM17-4 TaxID=2866714 RepID=UPI00351D4E10